MKRITWIVLFLCGMIVASNAQTTSANAAASENTEVKASNNDLSVPAATAKTEEVSVVSNDQSASTVEAKTTVSKEATSKATEKAPWKKWKDRTVAGKILVGVGMGIFIILCLLFGTVSVG